MTLNVAIDRVHSYIYTYNKNKNSHVRERKQLLFMNLTIVVLN
jgi:hypothetical protein